jgi:hypothetical protein
MDTDTDQTSESTPVVSSEAPASTTEASPAPETKTDSPSVSEGGETVSASPAFTPNYKLKVYDTETELEDPFLKALIKDADSEKKVKEIAQKFLGFDTVKKRHEETKTEYNDYINKAKPIVEYYQTATKHLQKGDLDSFFEQLQIPKDAIYRYAIQKAEEAQLDPQTRANMEQQRQVAKQREYLESQNQTLQSQQQQQVAQFRAQELGWTLQRPDVAGIAQAFDQRVGRQGAFRQAVIDKGLSHHAATQGREDLSVEQATQEVMKLLGAVVGPTGQAAIPGSAQGQQLIQQNGQPPIIPNVTGRGTSPVKKQVRSIADLKKKREELNASSS